MIGRAQTASTVYDVIARRWPGRFEAGELTDEASLGEGGIGLDSIEIVELLLECEDLLGTDGADELLEAGPISIGALIDHLARA